MNSSRGADPGAPTGVDVAALGRWLAGRLEGFTEPLELHRFGGGQSNPTFRLHTATRDYVLRKQPAGELLPTAHAIDREFRVLNALADSGVPVPTVHLYCADPDVIGTPFYVMQFVPGRIFTDPSLPELTVADRRAAYDSMNAALAGIHTFDWQRGELADYGRPDNFVARQLARWSKQYAAARTDDVPEMERLVDWLGAHIPDDERATISHGDFRIGNLVYEPGRASVAAVLDWELSTIGHPMSDLAFNCMIYHLSADDDVSPGVAGLDLTGLGIPDEATYLRDYAARTGVDPTPHWRFYMAFSLFRTAAIQQGVYARSLQGTAAGDGRRFERSYRRIAEAGVRLIETH